MKAHVNELNRVATQWRKNKMEDDYLLDYEEAKKLAKWNRILDEVEEWIVDWTTTSMHPPRREDCERDLSHIKQRSNMNDNSTEELLKDLRTLIVMLKGTEDQYGLLDWVDSYYFDYTKEALNFCIDIENKYLNSKAETITQLPKKHSLPIN